MKWEEAQGAMLPGWRMGDLLLEPDTLAGEISIFQARGEGRFE